MVTFSSSTADRSAESDGANDHELPNFSTKAHLAEVLVAKKSTVRAWVFIEGFPTAYGMAYWLL